MTRIRKHPSKKEWRRIAATFPVKQLNVRLNDFQRRYDPSEASPRNLFVRHETLNWEMHLQHRIRDAWNGYVLLNFFYNMGIPDNPWSIEDENGTKYFPHFDKTHYEIKDQFDFYTDVFYYKVFSAWDTLGQILCLVYELKLPPKQKPSFASAMQALKAVDRGLFDRLQVIRADPEFDKAKKFRNDITHNFLSNALGSDVRLPHENMMTFGGRTYTPSTVFKDNVFQTLHLFAKSLEVIKDAIALL
jgi:Cthe_2314-like HEPN